MAVVADEPGTLEDLVRELGGVPLSRICRDPKPGTVTERHVLKFMGGPHHKLYELVDGTLVEKPAGGTASRTSQPARAADRQVE